MEQDDSKQGTAAQPFEPPEKLARRVFSVAKGNKKLKSVWQLDGVNQKKLAKAGKKFGWELPAGETLIVLGPNFALTDVAAYSFEKKKDNARFAYGEIESIKQVSFDAQTDTAVVEVIPKGPGESKRIGMFVAAEQLLRNLDLNGSGSPAYFTREFQAELRNVEVARSCIDQLTSGAGPDEAARHLREEHGMSEPVAATMAEELAAHMKGMSFKTGLFVLLGGIAMAGAGLLITVISRSAASSGGTYKVMIGLMGVGGVTALVGLWKMLTSTSNPDRVLRKWQKGWLVLPPGER